MATKTLLIRPYIISASRINLVPIIHQIQSTTKPYSTIVVSISSRIASKSICSSSSTKSRIGTRNGNPRRMFATFGNGSGSIDSPLIQSMESKIKEQLNAESVSVKDANGDGRHVSIDVISESFEGQSAVNRQRMVYKAIWEELQNTVHAVDQMTTKTPAEAAAQK